jgi:hypothetical protein
MTFDPVDGVVLPAESDVAVAVIDDQQEERAAEAGVDGEGDEVGSSELPRWASPR